MAEEKVKEIPSDQDFIISLKQAVENQTRIVVDFSASWCGPCKDIAPLFKSLSAKYPNIEFWKVDGDKCKVIVQSLAIKGYPTFHYYIGDTLVLQNVGGDKKTLEENVKKLNDKTKDELVAASDNKKDNFVEGDLYLFEDEKRCECLNDSNQAPFTNIFVDNSKNCSSDSDAQLLLTIGYQQLVRIKTIKIIAPENGPMKVKLFVNCPNLEFDSAEEKVATQVLKLSPNDLKEDSKPIALDIMKFSSVDTITLFVENNQNDSDWTEISRLILSGTKA